MHARTQGRRAATPYCFFVCTVKSVQNVESSLSEGCMTTRQRWSLGVFVPLISIVTGHTGERGRGVALPKQKQPSLVGKLHNESIRFSSANDGLHICCELLRSSEWRQLRLREWFRLEQCVRRLQRHLMVKYCPR